MNVLILQKWLTDWDTMGEKPGEGVSKAPSIINAMIAMFLNFGHINPDKELPVIENQEFYCKSMLFLATMTPPWMLFVKPLLMKRNFEEK